MLFIQTPTPTPLPPAVANAIDAAVGENVNQGLTLIIQAGAIGILGALALAVVFVAGGWFIRQIRGGNRQSKEETAVTGSFEMAEMLNEVLERVQTQYAEEKKEWREHEAERDKKNAADREASEKKIEALTTGYEARLENLIKSSTEATSNLSGGVLRWAEAGEKNTIGIDDMNKRYEAVTHDLEAIKKTNEEILRQLKPCAEAKNVVNDDIARVVRETLVTLGIIEATVRTGVEEEKRRTDSRPIPAILVDPPTELGATA